MNEQPVGVLASTSIDCPDPYALADFYRRLLGMKIIFEHPEGGLVAISDGARVLTMMRVSDHRAPSWPSPEVPQQLHLDIAVDDLDDAVRRTLELGAEQADHQPAPEIYRVFLDPAGHPFCLTTARP